MKRDLQPLPRSDHLVPHSEWGAREPAGQGTRHSPHQQGEDMTQQIPQPTLPSPYKPAKRNRFAAAAFVVLALTAVSVVGVALWASDGLTPVPTTHTVEYQATADAAYGSGRTGMVTAQAPGGTTQKTGLLPITGTYTFHSGDFVYLSVQNGQGLGSVTCRITVDGVVVSENTSSGGYTIATCQGRVS